MAIPLINFDNNLSDGQRVDGVIFLVGFAQTPNSAGSVKIYVDDRYIGTATYPTSRTDVPNSGFTFYLNTEGLPEGPRVITARSFDANGVEIADSDRHLIVDRTDPLAEIESGAEFGSGVVSVNGWALAEDGFRGLEVLVNGRLATTADYGTADRNDVAADYPEYGIVKSGFQADLDTSGLPQGWNTLTLVGITQAGARSELATQEIYVDHGVQAVGAIETPTARVNSSGAGFALSGWAAADAAPVRVDVFLDDRRVGTDFTFVARADVVASNPGYGWTGGWSVRVPDDALSTGLHDLRVVATFADGRKVNLDEGETGVRELFVGYTGHDISAHLNPQNDYAATVKEFEAETGVDLDSVMYFQAVGATFNTWPFLPQQLVDAGTTPVITWESHGFTSAQIAAGECDAIITNFAKEVAAFGHEVIIRFNHEFQGDYYDWAGLLSNNDPAAYVAAWRRTVGLFEAAGADNVRFMWSPNNSAPPQVTSPSNDLRNYYPGDGYVDLIGVSGYNWGNDPNFGAGWAEAPALFDIFMEQIATIAPDKPIVMAEIGTLPDYGDNDSAQWIRDTFAKLDDYAQVREVIWFNDRAFAQANGTDFRVTEVSDAWGEVAADTTAAFTEATAKWDRVGDVVAFRNDYSDYTIVASGAGGVAVTGDHGREVIAAPEKLIFADVSLRTRAGDLNANVLSGVGDASLLLGGRGDDTYVTDGDDRILELVGSGIDLVESSVTLTLGANLENLTLTGQAVINGTGNALANTLRGNASNNTLRGVDGNDVLSGGLGNDVLEGGAGVDRLTGGAGADRLDGGLGLDTADYADAGSRVAVNLSLLTAQDTLGAGLDTLVSIENVTGSGYADLLKGNGGPNVLSGGAGDDTLEGGLGNDTLNGGDGVDTASYAGATVAVNVALVTTARNTVGAGVDLLTGIENLTGGGFNDELQGDAGANLLTGGAGADVLLGLAGADVLAGGDGADVLVGGLGNDSLIGGAGTDSAQYYGASGRVIVDLRITTAQNTVNAGQDTLSQVEDLLGSNFDDLLTGNDGANRLSGGTGADKIEGVGGTDTLFGGLGDDTILGGLGVDTLYGGAGNDSLNGGDDADTLWGEDGVDTLAGAAGNDRLWGGVGADTLSGDAGADTLDGGDADDTLQGGADNDLLIGGLGNDGLSGGAGHDVLRAGVGVNQVDGGDGLDMADYAARTTALWVDLAAGYFSAADTWDSFTSIEGVIGGSAADTLLGTALVNVLKGGAGDDVLIGQDGDDYLEGGLGVDRLVGGGGHDTLIGGAGRDILDLSWGGGWDTVTDFNPNQDRIDLGGRQFLWAVTGDYNGDGVADTQLTYDGGTLVVHGISLANPDSWDAYLV